MRKMRCLAAGATLGFLLACAGGGTTPPTEAEAEDEFAAPLMTGGDDPSVTVQTGTGVPDSDEAEGLGNADRLSGPCEVFEVQYFIAQGGDLGRIASFTVRKGSVTALGTEVEPSVRGRLAFSPTADEAVVLHASKYGLEGRRCHP